MRFIIVILLVLGAVGYGGYRVSTIKSQVDNLGRAPIENALGRHGLGSPDAVLPYPTSTDDAAVAVSSEIDTSHSAKYVFRHREIPSLETLSQAASALQIVIFPDPSSRTLYVSGSFARVTDFEKFLQTIDIVQGSCAVQTWSVYVDKKVKRGFDLVAAIRSVVPSAPVATLGAGAFTLDLGSDDIALALAVIADGSSVEVLQRPHVRLEHGTISRIESISEVPIPVTSTSQGIAQTSVEYRKVGLQLEVTPFFFAADRVRLQVSQTNGLIGQNVDIGGNEIPVIQSQTVSTSATVSVGQTVILGGVSTIRETLNRGLLRNVTERTEGSLYVILSTYHDEPKAVPVDDLSLPSVLGNVPLATPPLPAADWIDGGLLPPRSASHK